MIQPIGIDLFCGLGGWTEGLLAVGYRVIGFDLERHDYGFGAYPAQLVIQDVLTLHGRQFKDAALIVASPPCQAYSYMAMPWAKAKQMAREYENGTRDVKTLTALFDACFRIQREASEAAGRHIPLVVENVRGAQRWVGRAKWHFGSYYLWGDVPALMPITQRCFFKRPKPGTGRQLCAIRLDQIDGRKNTGGSSFAIAHNASSGHANNPRDVANGIKNGGRGTWFGDYQDQRKRTDGIKQGGDWFNDLAPSISRQCSSKSPARKAAAAMIAKIPFTLARHIGASWHPGEMA